MKTVNFKHYNNFLILTPKWHEYGEEDRDRIIDEEGELGDEAAVGELPVVAVLVADRAHRDVVLPCLVADIRAARQ